VRIQIELGATVKFPQAEIIDLPVPGSLTLPLFFIQRIIILLFFDPDVFLNTSDYDCRALQ